MSSIITNLAIAGYRSFGKEIQYFPLFGKINIFIGQNNSGKSNIIRFLREVCSRGGTHNAVDRLAQHLPGSPPLLVGVGEPHSLESLKAHRLVREVREGYRENFTVVLAKLFAAKARYDKTGDLCWSISNPWDRSATHDTWTEALKALSDQEVQLLWHWLTGSGGGSRFETWERQIIERIPARRPEIVVEVIPAIRQIGARNSAPNGFDGSGIIDRLAKLQNPDVHNQSSRERFAAITAFLREVLDRPEAQIEIPYDRDTILVHMDGKVLPIDSLGSGVHEVLILAAAATVLSSTAVCIEEPELHLNPILQRKLARYLEGKTDNQYFITTHSAVLMDTPGAEIYHVRSAGGASRVERVTSDMHRSAVCADLGYHPSDLLQTNCVIWVEGPSDRIYLNWWLQAIDSSLVEGIHYSVMFYGGRLAAHLSNAPDIREVEDFISLRRLNCRGVMILDSDRAKTGQRINATKLRLQREFDSGPGHAWITDGREIENYLAPDQVGSALAAICPNAQSLDRFDRYDKVLSLRMSQGKEGTAPKVEIARYVTMNFSPDLGRLNLGARVEKLHRFILDSNPAFSVTKT